MKKHIVLMAAALGLVGAVPHRHQHHAHVHEKRDPSPVADTAYVAGPTVIMYSLNGAIISEDEVLEGIKNGTLIWANGAPAAASAASSSSTPAAAASSTSAYVAPASSSSSSTYVAPSSSSTHSSAAASSTSSTAASSTSSSSSSSSTSTGIDATFPDGEISCSEFPSAYGAVALDYLNLGGWSGVQSPGSTTLLGFLDIETITESTCSGDGCCSDGMYCSYACPAGYQKSQWPTTQGSTGQSVGGLLCKNGKLYKTNSDLSDSLCITGADDVTILVRNEMSSNAAVCRTDYPGTESETIPVNIEAGSTSNLTCPDASTYYKWGSDSTSAQYYVNPAGVSSETACQWGSEGNDWGNYAPLNIGVGYSDGAAWLAIFQNSPTTNAKLDYTVTIEGDNLSGKCRYSNGEYCSGDDYSTCSTTTGCTVSITEGTATFVFSSS